MCAKDDEFRTDELACDHQTTATKVARTRRWWHGQKWMIEGAVASAYVDEKDDIKGDNKEDAATWEEVGEKVETTKGDNKEDAAESAEVVEKTRRKATRTRR